MKIINFSEYGFPEKLYEMWNREYDLVFPISKKLFCRNARNLYNKASFIALDQDEPVGFILSKIWDDEYKINGYDDCGWINLIYVLPQYRKKGIGTALLEKAENEFELLNKKTIFIGKDYYNYFPGLPCDMKNSLGWFIKRGYENPYNTYDLICNRKMDLEPLINTDFVFRSANVFDKLNLIEFMNNNWPGRWTKEVVDYFESGGTGREYLLCLDNDKICAFAKVGYPNTSDNLISYSMVWRNRFSALGGIGPLGVDKEYRKRHLGRDIVIYGKNVLIENKVSDIIIDWTGLLDFYRPYGFEVWKSYHYLTKLIKEKKHEF